MHHLPKEASGTLKPTAILAQASLMECQLLAATIERQCRLEVVACGVTSSEVENAVRTNNPDLLLISARLQDGPYAGLRVAKNLQASNNLVKIVMLLDSEDRDLVVKSFCCGAKGIFTRNEESRKLCKCIAVVLQGQIWASNAQMKYVVEALAQMQHPILLNPDNLNALTKREYEVVRLLAAGFSNREIGDHLRLNENTVKNYVSGILHKLGLSTRIELALYFLSQEERRPQRREGDTPIRKFGT